MPGRVSLFHKHNAPLNTPLDVHVLMVTIGVAKIFDWGGKPQITCNDVIKIFWKKNFLWGKDIVEWKIRSLVWHLTKILLKKEGSN